jgi:hypothetical protein
MYLFFQSIFRKCARCSVETASRETNEKVLGKSPPTRKLFTKAMAKIKIFLSERVESVERRRIFL